MICRLRRNLDVTWIPIERLHRWLKRNNWRVIAVRYENDRVLMDLWRMSGE